MPPQLITAGASARGEVVDWSFWDSEAIAAAQTEAIFFEDNTGKSRYQSNMRLSGQIPSPQYFGIFSITFGLEDQVQTVASSSVNLLTVLTSMLEDSRLDFELGNKPVLEIPLYYLPAAGGVYGSGLNAQDDAAAAAVSLDIQATNGPPGWMSRQVLKKPLVLTPNEDFRLRATWGHGVVVAGLATPRVFIGLHGVLFRSVQ